MRPRRVWLPRALVLGRAGEEHPALGDVRRHPAQLARQGQDRRGRFLPDRLAYRDRLASRLLPDDRGLARGGLTYRVSLPPCLGLSGARQVTIL